MPNRTIMTQTMNASQARQNWSELLNKVFRKETRVIVEKSGIPVAAIISAEDLQRFTQLEAERTERFKALEQTWEAFKDVPSEEVEEAVTSAIDEVRGEKRQRNKPTANL